MKKYGIFFLFYNTAIFSEVPIGLGFEIIFSINDYKIVIKRLFKKQTRIIATLLLESPRKCENEKFGQKYVGIDNNFVSFC